MQVNIWNIIYLNCSESYEDINDHHDKIRTLTERFRLERDSNLWTLWYRWSALPTELSSHVEAGHLVSSCYSCRSDGEVTIEYMKIQNIWTTEKEMERSMIQVIAVPYTTSERAVHERTREQVIPLKLQIFLLKLGTNVGLVSGWKKPCEMKSSGSCCSIIKLKAQ